LPFLVGGPKSRATQNSGDHGTCSLLHNIADYQTAITPDTPDLPPLKNRERRLKIKSLTALKSVIAQLLFVKTRS
jgi:hypothetical protein